MTPNHTLGFKDIEQFLDGLLGADMHAKRVLSLANATLGVVRTGSLAVHAIGQGLAVARGLKTKHAVKQVDRLLSNDGIDLDAILPHWVRHVVGARADIKVAMDWTDFDADKQTTIMLSLMTGHGRATPLVWLTVDTATLKDHRNEYEYRVLVRLADMLPSGIKLEKQEGNLIAVREKEEFAAIHGLTRALVSNAVEGVTKGWTKELDIVGIGYRAELKGKGIVVFTLGFSHPIEFPLPTGIEVAIDPKQTHITVSGIDRQKVGQVAADMRSLRKPDPYKNKGVRYTGERLKKKVGKTGAK